MSDEKERSTEIEVGDRRNLAGPPWQAEGSQLADQQVAGYQRFQPEEEGFDWRRYVAAVYRYKWLILLVTLVGTGAGIVGTRELVRLRYRAEATIWVESEQRGGAANRGPLRSGLLLNAYSWVQLMETYAVLEQVVRDRHLYLSFPPEHSALFVPLTLKQSVRPGAYRLEVDDVGKTFTLWTGDGAFADRGSPGDSIGADSVGFSWVPPAEALKPGLSVDFTVVTYRDAAKRLKGRLKTSINRDSDFMKVQLVGSSPEQVASILSAVIERYVQLAADIKRARLRELTAIIGDQLEIAQREVASAESELQEFRVATITLPSEPASPLAPGLDVTRDPVFSHFFDMKIKQEQLRRDANELRRILEQSAMSSISTDAIEVIAAVQTSSEMQQLLSDLTAKRAELRALRMNYLDDWPDVRRVNDEVNEFELVAIPRALGVLLSVIVTQQAQLASDIDTASQDLQRIPPRVIEQGRLQLARSTAQTLHGELSRRYQRALLEESESSIPDVRVLDPPMAPKEPMENQAPQIIFMVIAGSLGVSVLGSILLDRSDRHVKYPVEVTRGMGLTILGAVPRVNRHRNGKQNERDLYQAIEALRGIRMSLMHAHGGRRPLQLTITSPGSGEGKSFVTSNLAISCAEAGFRTLLIDGDVRRGQLHRMFNVARKPGLTDMLAGSVSREKVVHETEYSSLFFISCGTRQQRAPELLGSRALKDLLDQSGEEFDVILVDSAPMAAGVDSFLLGSMTGNLVLVLRTGTSDRHVTEAKLEELDRLPIRVLGAVLNDVRSNPVNRYYYQYSSYYLPGYELKNESDGEEEGGQLLPPQAP